MLAEDTALLAEADAALAKMEESLKTLALDKGIAAVLDVVRAGNRYFDAAAPWTLAKQGNTERLETVIYTVAETMRRVAVLLDPVMPGKMKELRDMLGMDANLPATLESLHDHSNVLSGKAVIDRAGLFMRIQLEENKEAAAPKKQEKKAEKAANVVAAEELIEIGDFAKVKLKTAKVLTAERVEGADKLLKLSIEVGAETRPLVAGVAQYYTPEEMVGKTIVIVANLKPAVIRGVESAGMLLAAKAGKQLKLVTVDGDMPSGASIG
jgi:methionyl-tRNA synthetase